MSERPNQRRTIEKTLTRWMLEEKKRKAVGFICAGLIAMVGAVWTDTYSYAAETESAVVTPPAPNTPSTAPETTFDVCIGEHYFCDRHTSQWVLCGTNVENYIKAQCEKFEFTAPMEVRGDEGMCGYRVYHVKCTAKR